MFVCMRHRFCCSLVLCLLLCILVKYVCFLFCYTRVLQETDLSPKIIYDEEIAKLKSDPKNKTFISKLPLFEQIKSTMYKTRKDARQNSQVFKTLCSSYINSHRDRIDPFVTHFQLKNI